VKGGKEFGQWGHSDKWGEIFAFSEAVGFVSKGMAEKRGQEMQGG